jgi:hypothetical protein
LRRAKVGETRKIPGKTLKLSDHRYWDPEIGGWQGLKIQVNHAGLGCFRYPFAQYKTSKPCRDEGPFEFPRRGVRSVSSERRLVAVCNFHSVVLLVCLIVRCDLKLIRYDAAR